MGCARHGPSLLASLENCASRGDLQIGSMQLSWPTFFLPTRDKQNCWIRRYSFVKAQGNRGVGGKQTINCNSSALPCSCSCGLSKQSLSWREMKKAVLHSTGMTDSAYPFFRTSPMDFPPHTWVYQFCLLLQVGYPAFSLLSWIS